MKKTLATSLARFGFTLAIITTALSASAQSKGAEYEGLVCWTVVHGHYVPEGDVKYNCTTAQGEIQATFQEIYKKGFRLVGVAALPNTNTNPQSNGVALYLERPIK